MKEWLPFQSCLYRCMFLWLLASFLDCASSHCWAVWWQGTRSNPSRVIDDPEWLERCEMPQVGIQKGASTLSDWPSHPPLIERELGQHEFLSDRVLISTFWGILKHRIGKYMSTHERSTDVSATNVVEVMLAPDRNKFILVDVLRLQCLAEFVHLVDS